MRLHIFIALLLLFATASAVLGDKHKKKKGDDELETETLPLLQQPPLAVTAETARLVFHVAPLTPRGLLSHQIKEGLKNLLRQNRGAEIVKIRAFVAGAGDMRRVQTILSETFTDKKLPLPALTTVQVGALPRDGEQVTLESIAVDKRTMNPNGLAFISGQSAQTVGESIAHIDAALSAAGIGPDRVLRVTCFFSQLDHYADSYTALTGAFPAAALDLVQMQRGPVRTPVECEAVAALARLPSSPIEVLDPAALPKSPDHSQIVLVSAPTLVITGSQLGFRDQEFDVRLAFERLGKALMSQGSSLRKVVMSQFYPLSDEAAERIRKLRFDFYDPDRPPASTLLPLEGLPSMDASFAIDVVAVGGGKPSPEAAPPDHARSKTGRHERRMLAAE
jgi:enamine deaminase RidA (YjgF/YER057c/UK114 family)